ncbi:hypothetical protein [Frigidibacter sp. MR17.24]|uniref:hypothetical protein n=1 Tax=Frigidibacter sp. MR17.24 TaxID=3127345 RepID=UPI003012BE3D
MDAIPRLRMLGLMLVALLTLAFGAAGHAHHVPDAGDLRLEAHLLAGGSIADLCADGGAGHHAAPGCPICHLIGAAVVPPAQEGLRSLEYRVVATVTLPRLARSFGRARDPAVPPRGPPARA